MNGHNNPTPESIIKDITLELLRINDITVTTEEHSLISDTIMHNSSGGFLSVHQDKCYTALNIDAVTPEIEDNNKRYLFNGVLMVWLEKAHGLELASPREDTAEVRNDSTKSLRVPIKTYTLTPKGLEVALKLQEHEDNERRFEQQSGISLILQDNSSKSVTTARWALALSVVLVIFGGYRVYQLEQKILSHSNMEQRIHSAEEEYSRLDEEVVRLKGELNRLIPVDNDKGKPVAVIVYSNTPATKP
jgi:DNA-binding PadR family transcriptional regulator